MSKKIKVAIIIGAILVFVLGLYALSRKLVDSSYSSYEYIKEREYTAPTDTEEVVEDGVNSESSTTSFEGLFANDVVTLPVDDPNYVLSVTSSLATAPDDADLHIYSGVMTPKVEKDGYFLVDSVYNDLNINIRCDDYLGSEDYNKYKELFSMIQEGIEEYMSGIKLGIYWDEYVSNIYLTDEDEDSVFDVSSATECSIEEILNNYKGLSAYSSFIGSSMYSNYSNMEAVYFFGGKYVVYRVKALDGDLFVVIDYSKSVFNASLIADSYSLVDFGCIARKNMYVPYYNSNIKTINGYTVIFTSDVNPSTCESGDVPVRYYDLASEEGVIENEVQ